MDERLYYLAAVLGLGLAAQWIAWRVRLPAILLLLVFGFAAGRYFHDPDPETLIGRDLLFAVVSLSVAVILFEGGLNLRLSELRGTGRAVLGLVTAGIAVTWALTAAAARLLLKFEPSMAVLLGAILVVSGPTVIMPLLRQIRPNRRVGSIVKWEGIVNDPIGAVLAFVVFSGMLPREGFQNPVLNTVAALVTGVAFGAVTALLLVPVLRRYWIPDYLENAALLTIVVVVFTASNSVWPESGLVAVTLLGVILANQKVAVIRHVIEFKENLRVVLISCLFIVLASRLNVADLRALGWGGLLFLAVLLLVVRPAAVLLSTFRTDLSWGERAFLSWMAPRGIVAAAVSSVFALELAAAKGLSPAVQNQAGQLVAATFLVIVGTVAVYGLTAGPLARWLKIAEANPQGVLFAGGGPVVRQIAAALKEQGYQVMLVDTNRRNLAAARMEGLPTCWANISSEYAQEEIDFAGIGRLLAMTPNDEVNALAVREFVHLFGRAEVYRLPAPAAESERTARMSPQRAGRTLFQNDANYTRLQQRLAAGAVVKRTGLSDEFDYEAFRNLYGDSAIVLFAVAPSGKLTVSTAGAPLNPQPGQTLISIVDPVEDPAEGAT